MSGHLLVEGIITINLFSERIKLDRIELRIEVTVYLCWFSASFLVLTEIVLPSFVASFGGVGHPRRVYTPLAPRMFVAHVGLKYWKWFTQL